MSLGASARLNARFGERRVLLAGLALVAGGLALLGRAPVGGALGLSALAALSAVHARGLRAGGATEAAALTGGYHLAFLLAAGLALASLAVAAALPRGTALSAGRAAAAAIGRRG